MLGKGRTVQSSVPRSSFVLMLRIKSASLKILVILWVIEGLEDKREKVSYKAITLNTSRYLLCEQLIINYTKKGYNNNDHCAVLLLNSLYIQLLNY